MLENLDANIYDENEHQIGIWLNKPLYRRVVTFQIPTLSPDQHTIDLNFVAETVLRFDTYCRYSDNHTIVHLPFYLTANNYCYLDCNYGSTYNVSIRCFTTNGAIINNPIQTIFEYTKP